MISITSQLGDITLMKYICEDNFNTCPSTEYDYGDIQSVKSGAGANATPFLPLTVSRYIDTIKNYDPKNFNFAIHCSIQGKPVHDEF